MSDRAPQGILPFTVPRHAFIPRQAWANPEKGERALWIDRDIDPDLWWSTVYSNAVIITQIDDGRTELTPESVRTTYNFTCSSSAPALVFAFLESLEARPGDKVLEIGTGTGWTAALLAEVAGDERVFSIEVDPALAVTAEKNLAAAGRSPRLIVGDGSLGAPEHGPFDRVHVTCGVQNIPYTWIAQTRPGGRIVLPWMAVYRMAALTVGEDGTASGRFHDSCAFMMLRSQRRLPDSEVPPEAEDEESGTTADPRAVAGNSPGHRAYLAGALPGIRITGHEKKDGTYRAILHGGHSHARVQHDGYRTIVEQRGPRRLWEEAVSAHENWVDQGSPEIDRFGLTVTHEGQYVWLDSPENPLEETR
ncbi:methyltransferase domain-containing protein [Streptomyces xiamenensis]